MEHFDLLAAVDASGLSNEVIRQVRSLFTAVIVIAFFIGAWMIRKAPATVISLGIGLAAVSIFIYNPGAIRSIGSWVYGLVVG